MTPARRRALSLARRAWVGLLVVAVVVLVVRSGDDLRALLSQARPGVLVAVPVLALGQLVLTSAVWSTALRALGAPVPLRQSLRATAVSAPARYLPGSVWFAAGRVALLRRHGAPVRALTAAATLEMLLVPVLGFAAGGALLALTADDGADPVLDRRLALPLLGVAALLLVLASPPVVNAALRFRTAAGQAPLRLGWGGLLRTAGVVLAFWAWSGGVFAAYVSAFPGLTDASVLTVVGAYLVAWGVGWLALFAPQGVGVVEVVLAGLLAGGAAELALVLGGYRLLVAVRDALAAGGAALLGGPAPTADEEPAARA